MVQSNTEDELEDPLLPDWLRKKDNTNSNLRNFKFMTSFACTQLSLHRRHARHFSAWYWGATKSNWVYQGSSIANNQQWWRLKYTAVVVHDWLNTQNWFTHRLWHEIDRMLRIGIVPIRSRNTKILNRKLTERRPKGWTYLSWIIDYHLWAYTSDMRGWIQLYTSDVPGITVIQRINASCICISAQANRQKRQNKVRR